MTYNEFIQNIISTRGRFGISQEEYKERHHIIPKCLGGSNDDTNLIDLYPSEHLKAHVLLFNENSDNSKIKMAMLGMLIHVNRNNIGIEEYNNLRKRIKGFKLSEEHKKKIGKANKGRKRPDLAEFNTKTKRGSKDSYETHLKKCKAQCRENNNNARKVINLDTGEIFGCLGDAARSVNGSTSGLCCYLRTDSRVGISFYKGYR